MLKLISVTVVLFSLQVQATQIAFKDLTNLVAEADHVFVGTVTKVDMVDGQGQPVTDKTARTGPGSPNQLRLHVTLDTNRILATTAKLPAVIVIPLWRRWHDTLGNRMQETQGKTHIFLLKGPDFQPVYHGLFMRELSEQAEVESLLKPKRAAASGGQATDVIRATLQPATNRPGWIVMHITNVSSNTVRFLDLCEGAGECGEFYEITVQKDGVTHSSQGNCLYAPGDVPKIVELAPGKTYQRNIQPAAYLRSEKHWAPPCSLTVTYRLSEKIRARWRQADVNLDFTFQTETVEIHPANRPGTEP
jgi:hypothetical protein